MEDNMTTSYWNCETQRIEQYKEGKMPHTQGPWFFYKTNTGEYAVCCDKGLHTDHAVAYLEKDLKEGDARLNATLIAAAPELLEALKAMCEEWRRHGCCDARDVEYKAEQAIKKAEGRSI